MAEDTRPVDHSGLGTRFPLDHLTELAIKLTLHNNCDCEFITFHFLMEKPLDQEESKENNFPVS